MLPAGKGRPDRRRGRLMSTRPTRSFLIEFLLVIAIIAVLIITVTPYLTGAWL